MDTLNSDGSAMHRFGPDDPARPEVAAVIDAHLALMRSQTPPEAVFALPAAALKAANIRFFSLSAGGAVVGIGAIRLQGDGTGELKSMHILAGQRSRGLGAALVAQLIGEARKMGMTRLFLETGTGEAHAAARRLYARLGFAECGPFGDYRPDPHSFFMVLALV